MMERRTLTIQYRPNADVCRSLSIMLPAEITLLRGLIARRAAEHVDVDLEQACSLGMSPREHL